MTTSQLLKYARARDDADFVRRISAALIVRAQEQEFWDLAPEVRSFVDYVLEHPMEPVPAMINRVSTNPGIAALISIENNVVDTSAVPDNDIQYVVNDQFGLAAKSMFAPVA